MKFVVESITIGTNSRNIFRYSVTIRGTNLLGEGKTEFTIETNDKAIVDFWEYKIFPRDKFIEFELNWS